MTDYTLPIVECSYEGVSYTLRLVVGGDENEDAEYNIDTDIAIFGRKCRWLVGADNILADDGEGLGFADIDDETISTVEALADDYISGYRDAITGFFGAAGWQRYLVSGGNQVTLYEVVTCDTTDEYAATSRVETYLFSSREQAQAKAVELGLAAIAAAASTDNQHDLHLEETVAGQYHLVADYCQLHTDFSISVREVNVNKESGADE